MRVAFVVAVATLCLMAGHTAADAQTAQLTAPNKLAVTLAPVPAGFVSDVRVLERCDSIVPWAQRSVEAGSPAGLTLSFTLNPAPKLPQKFCIQQTFRNLGGALPQSTLPPTLSKQIVIRNVGPEPKKALQAMLVSPAALVVVPATVPDAFKSEISVLERCDSRVVWGSDSLPAGTVGQDEVTINLDPAPGLPQKLCIQQTFTYTGATQPAPKQATLNRQITINRVGAAPTSASEESSANPAANYLDKDWLFTVDGGVEQSILSAQSSQTNPFINLFVRAPVTAPHATVWLRARFLGSPTASDTSNIISTYTDPTGSIKSQDLATVGKAVDYVIGTEYDFRHPGNAPNFSVGLITGFGATSTLSSQVPSAAFAVPAPGTNECTQLHARLGNLNDYKTPLPGGDNVTTTTTIGSGAPTKVTAPYCVVVANPSTASTTDGAGVTTVVTKTGTPITNIAFTPEDRTGFLLKYVVGVRLVTRFHSPGHSACGPASTDGQPSKNPCTRDVVDFTVGQDEAITGGRFHGMVFKSDASFPIRQTGIVFFATAAIRMRHNTTQPTLILASTPLATGSGAAAAGSVVVPSPSVFVLPYRQPDRDFYRIGIALDLTKILPKLFGIDKKADTTPAATPPAS